MSITTITHPPHTQRLETPDPRSLESVLPRLGAFDRIAVRIAVRAIVRLQRELESAAATPQEIALGIERARGRPLAAVLARRSVRPMRRGSGDPYKTDRRSPERYVRCEQHSGRFTV